MVYLTPLHTLSLLCLVLMRAVLILLRLLPLYVDLVLLCLCVSVCLLHIPGSGTGWRRAGVRYALTYGYPSVTEAFCSF
ncbi:hypothetical protein V8C40DRAFT_193583 [Trichoderma camerunense]